MAESIGDPTQGCTKLASLTLGISAPHVGRWIFTGIDSPTTVTVRMPNDAECYGTTPTDTTTQNWGEQVPGHGRF